MPTYFTTSEDLRLHCCIFNSYGKASIFLKITSDDTAKHVPDTVEGIVSGVNSLSEVEYQCNMFILLGSELAYEGLPDKLWPC